MNAAASALNGVSVGFFIVGALDAAFGEWRLTAVFVCLAAAAAMACWYWSNYRERHP